MTKTLLQRRQAVLGSNAPLFYEEPVHLVQGEGVWLYDIDGNRYLDAYNNVPVVGHCHPKVVAALSEQSSILNVHTRYLDENVVRYGENLIATLPDQSTDWRVTFTCTGSEANELALRLARSITGKQGFIGTDLTYHGNTAAVFEFASIMMEQSEGGRVQSVPYPQTYHPLNGLSGDALRDAYLDAVAEQIRALEASEYGFTGVLMCPILANEGVPNVPDGYWPALKKLVHEAGGVLIFDEVQSGFGRTGKMWGHEWTGVTPDVITLGKPMGNGHPLAGMIARAELFDRFHADSRYFNTFGGNPVSCAVGQAVLDVLAEEDLVNHTAEVSQYLAEKLVNLQAKYPLIGDVRHKGMFIAIELVTDRETKEPATAAANAIVNGMKNAGILISSIGRKRNELKIRPPLPFGKAEADILVKALDQQLQAIS